MPKFANKAKCTGCTACANICPHNCIQMKEDNEGFLFPEISNASLCIECGVCEKACPILNEKEDDLQTTATYSAISKNESIRLNSSSGGIFSEIAIAVLNAGGVVYGASYDTNCTVRHIQINSVDDLPKLRGAKYSQSILDNSFKHIKDILKTEKTVLFSGTPCQIAGLKAFLGHRYENLICIDFVCHGVPSPMVWSKYIQYRANIDCHGTYPEAINLRNKQSGWSQYSYSVEFIYPNKYCYLCENSKDPFMNLFVENYILRQSCGDCNFKGYNRISDITLADFWGIWNIDKSMDDNKGTSLVLTHTHIGEQLFNSIKQNIKFKQVSLEQSSCSNPSMLVSSVHKDKRNILLQKVKDNGFDSALQFLEAKTDKQPKLYNIKRIIKKIVNIK